MFDLFDFDLPGAVTDQLERGLNSMPSSLFNEESLQALASFLSKHKLDQGVYQILYKDEVVYVGKAIDVSPSPSTALVRSNFPSTPGARRRDLSLSRPAASRIRDG